MQVSCSDYASSRGDRAGEQRTSALAVDGPASQRAVRPSTIAVSRSAASLRVDAPADRGVLHPGRDRRRHQLRPRGAGARAAGRAARARRRRRPAPRPRRPTCRAPSRSSSASSVASTSRARCRRRSWRRGALVGVVERRPHEPVAIAEVVVDQRDGDARLRGDGLDAEAAHAAAGDHADGGVEDRGDRWDGPSLSHGSILFLTESLQSNATLAGHVHVTIAVATFGPASTLETVSGRSRRPGSRSSPRRRATRVRRTWRRCSSAGTSPSR